MSEPEEFVLEPPPDEASPRRDVHGIGIVGISVLVFILGVVVGIPIANFGVDVLVSYATQVFAVLFGVFVIVLIVAGLIVMFRRRIWQALFRRAELEVQRFARPLGDMAQFAAEQRVGEATRAARDLAELALARYAWVSTRRWLLGTITGLVAAIAALAGSALLFQQNQLLRAQGELMAEQTLRLNEQTKMLETQIQLGEAQRSTSVVPEILAIGAAIGEATANMPVVVTGAGSAMLPLALRARIVAATLAARPYRYLVYGLDALGDDDIVASAIIGRTDLPRTLSEMRSRLAERDAAWGLGDADPQAAAGELTDRIVSPERGQILGTLHNGGILDLGQLIHEGADFSFSEVRTPTMDGAGLRFGRLAYADFSRVSLAGANFGAARLDHARFVGASFDGALFSSIPNDAVPKPFGPNPLLPYQPTRLIGTDFSLASVFNSEFRAVQAVGARFDGAALFDSDFAGAFLLASTFRNAILYRVGFAGADLTKVDFAGAVVFEPDFLDRVAGEVVWGTFDKAAYRLEPIEDVLMTSHPNLNALARLPIEVQNGQPPLRLIRIVPLEEGA